MDGLLACVGGSQDALVGNGNGSMKSALASYKKNFKLADVGST